jgi:hypothetical protein
LRDIGNLKPIGMTHCTEYATEARFYIDATDKSGQRHLVVHYAKGGYKGAPEFATAIPDAWSEQDVIDLIFRPRKHPTAPYPAWEVPARTYGGPALFRWWWSDEKSK